MSDKELECVAPMRVHCTRNYLHYGDFLKHPVRFPTGGKNRILKSDARRSIADSQFSDYILRTYGPKRSRKLNLRQFKSDIENSVKLRRWFRTLGIRGFSYRLGSEFVFRYPLHSKTDLRFGLFFFDDLFYPPKVRRYFQRQCDPHILTGGTGGAICLGFALGRKMGPDWALLTLQSDYMFRRPSYVRDHIRGWQRVLLSEVVQAARKDGAARILMAGASDQADCRDPRFSSAGDAPESWKILYDGTAAFFDMVPVQWRKPINVQVINNLQPVNTDRFYVKEIA